MQNLRSYSNHTESGVHSVCAEGREALLKLDSENLLHGPATRPSGLQTPLRVTSQRQSVPFVDSSVPVSFLILICSLFSYTSWCTLKSSFRTANVPGTANTEIRHGLIFRRTTFRNVHEWPVIRCDRLSEDHGYGAKVTQRREWWILSGSGCWARSPGGGAASCVG